MCDILFDANLKTLEIVQSIWIKKMPLMQKWFFYVYLLVSYNNIIIIVLDIFGRNVAIPYLAPGFFGFFYMLSNNIWYVY